MTATIICPAADATTTTNICISDNATPANGTYAVYLNGKVGEVWDFTQVGIVNTGTDVTTGTDIGQLAISISINENKYAVLAANNTNWENLKKALSYWTDIDNNSTLYFTFTNSSNSQNDAQWPISATLTQIKLKLKRFQILEQMADYKTFNILAYRVTK